jgi:hypothetical protein
MLTHIVTTRSGGVQSSVSMNSSAVRTAGYGSSVSVELNATPGAMYLVDCQIGNQQGRTYTVSMGPGVQQQWTSAAAAGHLAFLLEASSERPAFQITANATWVFVGCDVFAL